MLSPGVYGRGTRIEVELARNYNCAVKSVLRVKACYTSTMS
jgi:hypothetical protein